MKRIARAAARIYLSLYIWISRDSHLGHHSVHRFVLPTQRFLHLTFVLLHCRRALGGDLF